LHDWYGSFDLPVTVQRTDCKPGAKQTLKNVLHTLLRRRHGYEEKQGADKEHDDDKQHSDRGDRGEKGYGDDEEHDN
jgi:hypothetical protein